MIEFCSSPACNGKLMRVLSAGGEHEPAAEEVNKITTAVQDSAADDTANTIGAVNLPSGVSDIADEHHTDDQTRGSDLAEDSLAEKRSSDQPLVRANGKAKDRSALRDKTSKRRQVRKQRAARTK